jgi:hypothetical protein
MLSSDDLLELQRTVLKAVLLRQPLPGNSEPVRFPDLSFVLRHPVIFLVDENLAGPISIEAAPEPISVVSMEQLLQEVPKYGDVAYLRFQPAGLNGDTVSLTLEAKIATSEQNKKMLGLSSIHVTFSRVGNAWKVIDDPVYSSA